MRVIQAYNKEWIKWYNTFDLKIDIQTIIHVGDTQLFYIFHQISNKIF